MKEEITFEEATPWVALIITLVGGFLRLFQLGTKGMWLDETFSVWLANQTVGEMLGWMVTIDQHPPLYYLLLHGWVAQYGDTPYYARLFSALFGIATIPLLYLTGKRMAGRWVGLAAAALLAFSPFHIYYAQEARMYTLLTFNAAVAMYALIRLLSDGRASQPIGGQLREYWHTWRTAGPAEPAPEEGFRYRVAPPQRGLRAWIYRHRWSPIRTIETDLAWIALIVFSAATLLTHNTAIFFLAATNLFILGLMLYQRVKKSAAQPAFQAPSLANWAKAQIGLLILWSPWIPAFIQQARRVDQAFWIPKPTWEIIAQTLRTFLNAGAPDTTSETIILWMMAAMLGLGLVYFRKKLSIFFFLATLWAVPFLGELLVSLRRPIFYDRTLIWITIPMLLLLAAGIGQLRFRALMVVMLGVFATNYVFSTGDYYRWYQKENWRSAAGFLAYYAENDDLVLFNSNFVVIPFDYYFKTWEDEYRLEVEKQGVPMDLYKEYVLEPIMRQDDIPWLITMIRGRERVWLVYSHDSYTDPQGLIPQTLGAWMRLSRERDYYGVKVQLYVSP